MVCLRYTIVNTLHTIWSRIIIIEYTTNGKHHHNDYDEINENNINDNNNESLENPVSLRLNKLTNIN